MGRPVTPAVGIAETASQLLTTSDQFEPFVPGIGKDPVRALAMLGQLEGVTRANLPSAPVATAPARPPVQAAPPASVPTPAPTPVYETSRPEYQQALSDPGLLAALARLHQQARRASTVSQKPTQERPQAQAPAKNPPPRQRTAPAQFAPSPIPEVAAELKTGAKYFRKSPGIFSPILRPQRPSKP